MNRGKFKLWHVINCLIVLVILILAPQHTAAQDDDVKGLGQSLSPGMSVALVCITSIFLLIAFISLLINRFTNIFGRSPPSLPPGRGVDPVVVITFPTFLYSHVKGHWTGQRALECAICLLEFKDNQILRLLPKCSHLFHPACIDAWLAFHVTCPLCRANLVPNLAEQQKSNSLPGNVTRSDLVDLIIDISDTTTPELINTPMQNRSVPTST